MANRDMKTCSTSLVVREVQIKTTVRYHLTLVRMAIIKKHKTNAGSDARVPQLLSHTPQIESRHAAMKDPT